MVNLENNTRFEHFAETEAQNIIKHDICVLLKFIIFQNKLYTIFKIGENLHKICEMKKNYFEEQYIVLLHGSCNDKKIAMEILFKNIAK